MARKKPVDGPSLPFDEPSALPDAAERARITSDLDTSLLVEAGAGSGKTHELASRMAAGIASGAYRIDQMVAVTFTRKAAAELRGRFQLALEARLDEADAPTAARVRDALANIERFFAGTIHAFCARLLRERPVEAGVAPGFVELDDAEDRLLRDQSWRDFREQAVAAGDADLRLLDDCGIKSRQLGDAFATVCLYEEVDFPPGQVVAPDDATAWRELEAFWAEIERCMPVSIEPDSKCALLEKAVEFGRHWAFARRRPRSPVLLAELLAPWDTSAPATGKWWRFHGSRAEQVAIKAEVQDLKDRFREATVTPFVTAWREYLYGVTVTVLVKARGRAAGSRRRQNVMNFNDLLGLTAAMLRTNAEVRRAMQDKYRWLFVDEFQDTDPLQAEILFLLAGDETRAAAPSGGRHEAAASSPAADWRTLPTRPGALFVVGDPKQSIYRFTRADIDIYNQVRARLAGPDGQGVVLLTANFRSQPDLCHWANTVFERLFPDEATSASPRYAPLVPVDRAGAAGGAEPAAPGRQQGLFTLTLPEANAVDEAARIARFIRAEVDAGRRRFGDFLVLTRKKRSLQVYAGALEEWRVPIEVSGGSGFTESEHVRQLALLLLALTDPQDQVALVGVLRGALFGLSDRRLWAWTAAGGYLGLFSELDGEVVTDAEPVARALAMLRRWWRWSRVLPAAAALERILDDAGYLALAASTSDGVDAGDLLHAIDRVRELVETGFTLFDAARALAAWSKLDDDGPDESTEVESLPLEPGRPDVVRLMNLHKAKGLEAPVVVLADPRGGFEPRVDARIIRDADSATPPVGYFQIRGPGRNGRPGKAIAQPVGWDQLEAEERKYLEAEETRLLYVAATRAKEMLVVSRAGGKGHGKPAWVAFDAYVTGAAELPGHAPSPGPAPGVADLSSEAAGRADRAIEFAHGAAVKPSWAATSVTAESKRFPAIAAVADDEAPIDDPTRTLVVETPSRRADAGLAWGTLVHGLLEHAMRFPRSTREDLERLARWLIIDEPRLEAVRDQAVDTVEAVRTSQRLQHARAAEHHEEVPFATLESREGAPRTVVTGTIDLVHRTADGWRVIDYKTDVDEAVLADRYAVQVEAYRQAWGRVAGGAVEKEIVPARRR